MMMIYDFRNKLLIVIQCELRESFFRNKILVIEEKVW